MVIIYCSGYTVLLLLYTKIHQSDIHWNKLWSEVTTLYHLDWQREVVLPHISFAPNNNIALMALIWRRHPSFVPYWVGYHWLAVRGWSGGQQCSISDTRRYKSSDLAPRTTSLASATAHPPPNPQFTTTFSIVTIPTIPTTTIPTTSLIAVAA